MTDIYSPKAVSRSCLFCISCDSFTISLPSTSLANQDLVELRPEEGRARLHKLTEQELLRIAAEPDAVLLRVASAQDRAELDV